MKRTRRAALAMMAGATGLLAADTFGHSSTRAERGVTVAVVGDEDAYLRLSIPEGPVATGRDVSLFTIENQFTNALTSLDVTIVDDGGVDVSGVAVPGELGPGANGAVTADIGCGALDPGSRTSIEFAVEAASSRERVETTTPRSVDVECAGAREGSLSIERTGRCSRAFRTDRWRHRWTIPASELAGAKLIAIVVDYGGTDRSISGLRSRDFTVRVGASEVSRTKVLWSGWRRRHVRLPGTADVTAGDDVELTIDGICGRKPGRGTASITLVGTRNRFASAESSVEWSGNRKK